MVRKLEIVFAALWFIILVIWVIISSTPRFRSIILPQPLFFWWILIGWIFLIYSFKFKSKPIFAISFILFLFSALLTTINLQSFAETIMRISFIGWIIGLVRALIEYKKT